MSRQEAVYVISVAAELAGVHPQTLRVYERKQLIKPFRTPGGTRRYSAADLERLALITQLTDQGMTLEGVRRVLALRDRVAQLEASVAELEQRLVQTQADAARRLRELQREYSGEIVLRDSIRRIFG